MLLERARHLHIYPTAGMKKVTSKHDLFEIEIQ